MSSILSIILVFFCVAYVKSDLPPGSPFTIIIDLQRNVFGTSENELKAFDNVDNSVYFKAINAVGVNSWNFVNLNSNALQSVSVDHVLDTEDNIKMIVATLRPNGSHNYKLEGLDSDGTVLGSLQFTITPPSNPQIVSCTNNKAKLYIPENYNNTYFSVNDKESNTDCSFQIVLPSEAPTTPHNLELPMTTCSISYYNQFQVTLREHEEFNVDADFNSLMTCSKISALTQLSTKTLGGYQDPDTDVLFEQGVLGTMYIHARGDPQSAITDNVQVGTPVTLRVSLGQLYKFNFDILPLVCSVNNVLITSSSCSVNTAIFGEFTKHSIGELSADFDLFRVIDSSTNVPSSSITVECTFYVATVDTSTGNSLAPTSPCMNYE